MNYVRIALLGLATLLLLCSPTLAQRRVVSSCAPYCYQPTYYQPQSYHYTSTTYSGWTYRVYPGTEYYYRVRNRVENGCYYPEQDIWLYVYHDGCYQQHCKIADYLAKPALVLTPKGDLLRLGTTDYGADAKSYAVAKLDPRYANLLQQQGVPSPVDVAGLLPPISTTRIAIAESVGKNVSSSLALMAQVHADEQATNREIVAARSRLAMQANSIQGLERVFGKWTEMQAVAAQQASVSAQANIAQIQIGDPALAAVISASCFRCHGGEKVSKGVDFRQVASWTADNWKLVKRKVERGQMPPAGEGELDDAQIDLFDAYYDKMRSNQGQVPPPAPNPNAPPNF